MNVPLPHLKILARGAFADVRATAPEHFRLAILGVIAHIIETCAGGERDAVFAAHPFLADYTDELAATLRRSDAIAAHWRKRLAAWENAVGADLPLRALAAAGLTSLEVELLLAVGLPEEDPRFSDLFEWTTGRERRPTAGSLMAWWRRAENGDDRVEAVRRGVLNLVRTGLVQVLNPEAPRSEWALAAPTALWDALRGEVLALPWLHHQTHAELLPFERYIAPATVTGACAQLPRLLRDQPSQLVIVRGPRRNGRKTLVGAVAHAMGKSMLVAAEAVLNDEPRWRLFGALSVVLGALPAIELELTPGENRAVAALPLVAGPIAVVAGTPGGIHTSDARSVLTITLALPDAACRRRHWRDAAPEQSEAVLDELARSMLLSSGNIRRVGPAATSHAKLDGRRAIAPRDVQLACRGLHGARLETLASRLETGGGLQELALEDVTRSELETLLARCRHREELAALAGEHRADIGVRALFTGPSGTGKTLAARLLSAALGKELYRVDLSATVNKYLGETEKNLERTFAAAEELDIVLLLDEGDALMAGRTDVGSSNDRYANLETNFLLQRIKSFSGILLVTTNAADRIDKAFARRMDVVIPFRAPDELRRYEILRLHLGRHDVDDEWLQEMACRCVLTGGQLRQVVTHAQLLALKAGCTLGADHLHVALLREYRKTGAHCPMKLVAARS